MKNNLFVQMLAHRRRRTGAASLGALSLLGVAFFVMPRGVAPLGPTAQVREGAIAETLTEPGNIGSSRLLLYGSTIAGAQVKIAEIVPESRAVAPGDVLIRFDS